MGLSAHNISMFLLTSTNTYYFYSDYSPLIDGFWTVLCDSGLVKNAQVRALKRV